MIGEHWVHVAPAQQVVVGSDVVRRLPEVVRALDARRALVVTTPGRADGELVERVVGALGRSHVGTFDHAERLVPAPSIQRGVSELRAASPDCLVSVGGGAAIDTAKALAFFAEQESGAPAAGFADRPVLPHVAVPTTLVGAAYTPTFSMLDPHTRRSTTAGGPTMVPMAVLADLDPIADLGREALAHGVGAVLGHAVDVVLSGGSDPEPPALAVGAIRMLVSGSSEALAEHDDPLARSILLDASVLSGRATQGGADGLARSLARLLAARTDAPYGALLAALVEHTTRVVADAVPADALGALAGALAGGGGPTTDDVPAALASLVSGLGVPTRLADLGVADEDLDAVARQSTAQRGVQASPHPLGEADVRALLEDAC